jgi:hypothetical protein
MLLVVSTGEVLRRNLAFHGYVSAFFLRQSHHALNIRPSRSQAFGEDFLTGKVS